MYLIVVICTSSLVPSRLRFTINQNRSKVREEREERHDKLNANEKVTGRQGVSSGFRLQSGGRTISC